MPVPSLELDTRELALQYERVSADRQFKAGQRLIQDLRVRSGETVLDVGCGTGLLAEYAADLVGPAGSVVGIDPLPLRIEIAQMRARSNLSFRVGNAYDLSGLPSDTFDVACMNAVFHWLAEKDVALRQILPVLKRGGRLGISTGAKESPNPLHLIKARVLSRSPYSQYPGASKTVAYRVSISEMETMLTAAGFQIDTLENRRIPRPELTPEAAIQFSEASSFGNFLGHLPMELRPQAREEIMLEIEKAGAAATRRERLHIVAIALKP